MTEFKNNVRQALLELKPLMDLIKLLAILRYAYKVGIAKKNAHSLADELEKQGFEVDR